MKRNIIAILVLLVAAFSSCKKGDPEFILGQQTVIADHSIAFEEVLRSIPEEYINAARNNLHIAYQHTSHGTHVSRGMFGLPGYKEGDDILFGITNNNPQEGLLDFRNYLNDPGNSEINVVMRSSQ